MMNSKSSKPAEEFGLGPQTTSVFVDVDGREVHCSVVKSTKPCISSLLALSPTRTALWLGNSQLHAINQYQKGQRTAPAVLHEALLENGVYLVTYSQPNANLQEHFEVFKYLADKIGVDTLILSLVFDDTREDGIRENLLPVPENSISLQNVETVTDQHDHEISKELTGLDGSIQSGIERQLTAWLSMHSTLWEARPELRGGLFGILYKCRNWLFGITPNSKRKIIRSRYKKNLEAFSLILASSKAKGIQVIPYIVPIRNDVELPYLSDEYKSFKTETSKIAAVYGFSVLDFEDVVPAKFWGNKDATGTSSLPEIDFMHFQESGHVLLASKLLSAVMTDTPATTRRISN